MRELTKSTISAGLASSLFGVRQFANSITPPRAGQTHPSTEAFNTVAQAMADQCGETLRETFHAADKLQREFVDLGFRFITLDQRTSSGGAGSWTGLVNQATEQVGQLFSGLTSVTGCGCGSNQPATGWGPVPPPPREDRPVNP